MVPFLSWKMFVLSQVAELQVCTQADDGLPGKNRPHWVSLENVQRPYRGPALSPSDAVLRDALFEAAKRLHDRAEQTRKVRAGAGS